MHVQNLLLKRALNGPYSYWDSVCYKENEVVFRKKISFVYRLCIILNKIRTKQTSPHAFFKIVALCTETAIFHLSCKNNNLCNYTSTKNQFMGCTCTYLETDKILFHFQIVCLVFFMQNKIKVIQSMTLRENAILVCFCFCKKK